MRKIIIVLFCLLAFCCNLSNTNTKEDVFIPIGCLDGKWESTNSVIEVNGKHAYMNNIILLNRHGSSLFFNDNELLIITSFNPNKMIVFNKLTKSTKKYIKISI